VTYSLRFAPRADKDLAEIAEYLAREAPAVAVEFVERLLLAIESLSEHPARGARPRDPKLRSRGYRILMHDPYLVFYKVYRSHVRIHRVLHGSRSYFGLL
jgi:toxin ParE1/3/4